MLKVVDGFDLKELNKYGFVYHYISRTERTFDWDIVNYINEEYTSEYYQLLDQLADFCLSVYVNERELNISYGEDSYLSDEILDVIYDLVKDGVVEKGSRK